ncbi:MAG: divergent polysaccharide deacetylase family protein [Candidatus Hydrogenedentes bacterium]|nr:divergent polysaccharide deacetylase family protein [Candidatus Hydrogenedentota bacterium]
MAVAIPNQESKKLTQNKRWFFLPFIFLGMFALTLFITGILALIFYVQFLNNRVVDFRGASEHFHTALERVLTEHHLKYEPLGEPKVANSDGKIFTYREYTVYLLNSLEVDELINNIRASIFRIGLSPKFDDSSGSLPFISASYSNLEIARIYLNSVDKKEDFDYIQLLKNITEYTRTFIKKNLPDSEIIESLAEFNSDSETTWVHKTITVICPELRFEDVASNYRDFLLSKYPISNLNIKYESNKIEVIYNFRKVLTISITNTIFDRNKINTGILSVKVPEFYLYYPEINRDTQDIFSEQSNQSENFSILFSIFPNRDPLLPEQIDFSEGYVWNYEQLSVRNLARVVIILDDGGYRNPENEPALDLPTSVIFSIIPDAYYAKQFADIANKKGFQVMIHLPMQNKPGVTKPTYSTELLTNMSEEEIRSRISKACELIPYGKGINNHTGSVFTLKPEPLRFLAKILKEKEMFFVDSVVVSKSIAHDIMIKEGVTAYKRDVFLDHEYTSTGIKNRLNELKSIAKKRGFAIGIGHFRELTIQVLKEEIPKFEREGIKLVNLRGKY